MKLKILLIIILLTLSNVNALGILEKNNYIEITPGSSDIYNILLWDKEKSKINIDLIEKPYYFKVIIKQNNFYLNSSSDNYVFVNNDYIPATNVEFLIISDEKTIPGEYLLKIKFVSESENNGLSVFQERVLNLKINVTGIEKTPKKEETEYFIKFNQDYIKIIIILLALGIAVFILFK